MTFTVYGIRLKGDIEVRYVGFTRYSVGVRRDAHLSKAQHRCTHGRQWHPLCTWLHANRDQVELIALDTAEAESDARLRERRTVEMFCALGHRLFNRHLVPAEYRKAA